MSSTAVYTPPDDVWRLVKEELPRKKKSWLTFDDFCAFCRERGIDSPHDQEAIAGYLHDLGLMLSYRGDDTLRKFGVLNPQWATKGIYQMLNAREIRDAGGTFTIKSFGEVLPARAYPEEVHPYLLALMIRFRLCHPLDTKGIKYLIPELLGKEEPSLEAEFCQLPRDGARRSASAHRDDPRGRRQQRQARAARHHPRALRAYPRQLREAARRRQGARSRLSPVPDRSR